MDGGGPRLLERGNALLVAGRQPSLERLGGNMSSILRQYMNVPLPTSSLAVWHPGCCSPPLSFCPALHPAGRATD